MLPNFTFAELDAVEAVALPPMAVTREQTVWNIVDLSGLCVHIFSPPFPLLHPAPCGASLMENWAP